MSGKDPHVFLPTRGNYHELLSFQKAEVIYYLTYRFCGRFLTNPASAKRFCKRGGLRERMTRARLQSRSKPA